MAYLGEEIKKLGFGLMRLPQKSEGVIDVEQSLKHLWREQRQDISTFIFSTILESTEQNILMSMVYGIGSVNRRKPV